ncbi:MAG: hypothetical protein AAGK97_18885, partial [Bacteroidota bacterium]
MKFISSIFLVLFASIAFTQSLDKTVENLAHYVENVGPEKIFVHTDKPYYTNGDILWAKIYLVDGVDHLKSSKSNVVYFEMFDDSDSMVLRQTLFLEQLGVATDFSIPNEWSEGKYTMRVYTNYMRNADQVFMYQKEIPIWIQNPRSNVSKKELYVTKSTSPESERSDLTLEFFPEGGDLVQGVSNNLLIRAVDKEGNTYVLNGKILDSKDQEVSKFKTEHFGMAKINIKPELGNKYKAVVN